MDLEQLFRESLRSGVPASLLREVKRRMRLPVTVFWLAIFSMWAYVARLLLTPMFTVDDPSFFLVLGSISWLMCGPMVALLLFEEEWGARIYYPAIWVLMRSRRHRLFDSFHSDRVLQLLEYLKNQVNPEYEEMDKRLGVDLESLRKRRREISEVVSQAKGKDEWLSENGPANGVLAAEGAKALEAIDGEICALDAERKKLAEQWVPFRSLASELEEMYRHTENMEKLAAGSEEAAKASRQRRMIEKRRATLVQSTEDMYAALVELAAEKEASDEVVLKEGFNPKTQEQFTEPT